MTKQFGNKIKSIYIKTVSWQHFPSRGSSFSVFFFHLVILTVLHKLPLRISLKRALNNLVCWLMRSLGSWITAGPEQSHPAGQRSPNTQESYSLWATAPPAPLSPEEDDTWETKQRQQVRLEEEEEDLREDRGRETLTWSRGWVWPLPRWRPSPGTVCRSGHQQHCRWPFSPGPPLSLNSPPQTLQETRRETVNIRTRSR